MNTKMIDMDSEESSWEQVQNSYCGTKNEFLEDCRILDTVNEQITPEERNARNTYLTEYLYAVTNYMSNGSEENLQYLSTCANVLHTYITELVKKYDIEHWKVFKTRQEKSQARTLKIMEKMKSIPISTMIGNA